MECSAWRAWRVSRLAPYSRTSLFRNPGGKLFSEMKFVSWPADLIAASRLDKQMIINYFPCTIWVLQYKIVDHFLHAKEVPVARMNVLDWQNMYNALGLSLGQGCYWKILKT